MSPAWPFSSFITMFSRCLHLSCPFSLPRHLPLTDTRLSSFSSASRSPSFFPNSSSQRCCSSLCSFISSSHASFAYAAASLPQSSAYMSSHAWRPRSSISFSAHSSCYVSIQWYDVKRGWGDCNTNNYVNCKDNRKINNMSIHLAYNLWVHHDHSWNTWKTSCPTYQKNPPDSFISARSPHQHRSTLRPRSKLASFIFLVLEPWSEQGTVMVAKSWRNEEEV
jgi:hypothetical protein